MQTQSSTPAAIAEQLIWEGLGWACELRELAPVLAGTSKLRKLDLSRNNFGVAFADGLSKILAACPTLATLDLSRNDLRGAGVSPAFSARLRMTLPRAGPLLPLFESLAPTLEELKLTANEGLGGRIPGEIGKFTKLTKLWLDHCGLEGARALSTPAAPIEPRARAGPIPPEIGNLTELWRLNLGNNELTGARDPAPKANHGIVDLSSSPQDRSRPK